MLKKFIKSFKTLPKSNRAMIYLMWIYSAGTIVSSIFINIYVFSLNKEISDVIIYNLFFTIFTFIGFSGIGVIMSIFQKNIKYMYYIAYILYIFSYLLLFILDKHIWVYLFAIFYWLWNWAFWCAVHTQELVNIKDKTRDIYSSIISSWENIIKIVVPLLVSVIFFVVWKFFDFSAYIILFLLLPIIYAFSFLFIKDIWDYVPSKITINDIKNFFNLKKYLFGQLYFLFSWFLSWFTWVIFPVVSILILKTEVNVGLFEWIITFISTFLVIFLANKRNVGNRVKIMWILSFLIFVNISIFAFNFSLIWYIIFTLLAIILNPLYRVSSHVFDLKLMDTIKVSESDFYPTMILREFSLWIGRILALGGLSILVYYWFNDKNILRIWLLWIWVFTILLWVAIALHMKYEEKDI